MKHLVLASLLAMGAVGCTSVDSTTVSPNELAANGEAVAVVQTTAVGITALFHIVDIIQADLDTVVNKLLISEAKAMGASRVELLSANTTPRSGIFSLVSIPFGLNVVGITLAQATGVAVK